MVKQGRLKILDGDTQRVSWRQGKRGFSRDWDGDPIAQNYNKEGLKSRPKHQPHMKSKQRPQKPEE